MPSAYNAKKLIHPSKKIYDGYKHTAAQLTSWASAEAAKSHVFCVLTVVLHPRSVVAVTHITLSSFTRNVVKPHNALATSKVGDGNTSLREAKSLAKSHSVLIVETGAAD
jgi:hypothetical protein